MRSFSFSSRSLGVALVIIAAVTSTSCFDPEHADEVNALGGETNGVGPGPYHRPGQPCRACHGGSGPGKPEFSIAGTIYRASNDLTPQAGVEVTITDVNKLARTLVSNEAGNFYVSIDEWSPTFPVKVTIGPDALKPSVQMQSPIGRNGGCGFCHYGSNNDLTHMGPVYVR